MFSEVKINYFSKINMDFYTKYFIIISAFDDFPFFKGFKILRCIFQATLKTFRKKRDPSIY